METVTDIINAFNSAEDLASEIGEKGVTVRAWRMRNSIPPRYWPAIESAAKRRNIETITIDTLAAVAIARSSQLRAG